MNFHNPFLTRQIKIEYKLLFKLKNDIFNQISNLNNISI